MKTQRDRHLRRPDFALPPWPKMPATRPRGEKEFNKCKACHTIQAPDGTDVVKGGKTGPNLYGVVGRQGRQRGRLQIFRRAARWARPAGLTVDDLVSNMSQTRTNLARTRSATSR